VVVPVAVAVGWELHLDNRVVVVHEVRPTVVVVREPNGVLAEIAYTREDTSSNGVNHEGSQLPDGDTSTPGVDAEIEEEVDE